METLRKNKAAATKGDRLFGYREKMAIRLLVLIGLLASSSAVAQMPRFGPVAPTAENSCAAALKTNQVEMSIGPESRWVTALLEFRPQNDAEDVGRILGALSDPTGASLLALLLAQPDPRFTLEYAIPGRIHAATQQDGRYYLFIDMKTGDSEGPFPAQGPETH
jgi:hypothetical protein